jgi:2-phosphosulfolactate phosphatase
MAATINVCFTPKLFPLYENKDSIVVIIDVLRATSAICTAFEHKVKSIIPVAKIEEAREYKSKGFLAAAERDGIVQDGFDFGNSPFDYMGEKAKDKTIVLTTTNGTQAIDAARGSFQVAIGSFLNLDAISDWLIKEEHNVILLCAGWKDKFNMEDSLFAGAVAEKLMRSNKFSSDCDSARAAINLYSMAKGDLFKFLGDSSHRNRLGRLSLERDIKYCLTPNQTKSIPVLRDHELVALQY